MVYTDRWCFATKIIKNTKDLRILCHFFRFATFDYRGDKVLVDHDSGLGWILLRTEISRRMKSHAVRPCARRRRSGCPFPGPPCRPGRRRTCVYGRNELHPSRHGHLTGLGRSDAPRRGRRGYFARRASHDTVRRGGRDKRGPPVWRRAISLRNSSDVKSLIPPPTAGTWPDRAAHSGGGAVVGADVPGGPPSARDV